MHPVEIKWWENINILIADALSVPVGDLTKNDPNWANEKDMGYNK